uniref:RanBD1 domain-containing protein n=1 Tax=Globisporangium ultimum (strain ATCC 200006 / CBS 805.95 / DAOM BR144) TaxID=431595 RepID=K3W9B6_GLOUD
MSTKMDREKPEVAIDDQQPNVKKVRLAVEAVTVVDHKAVDETTSSVEQTEQTAEAKDVAVDEVTSAENSPKEADAQDATAVEKEVEESANTSETTEASTTTTTTTTTSSTSSTGGSAFGGFSAFSGTSGFSAFAAASSGSSSGFGAFASSASGSSSGFAAFQSSDTASFSSFGASSASESGFGTTASSSESVEFGSNEVKKAESTFVPALTDAEIANGEEGEQILVEKRAKLFKLVDNDYSEVGIGPLRVLRATAAAEAASGKSGARIVMRRESYVRGPGTKLLLNARLNACLACVEKTDKSMLLTIVETSEEENATKITPSTYLIRFGASDDFHAVLDRIHPFLPSAAASS